MSRSDRRKDISTVQLATVVCFECRQIVMCDVCKGKDYENCTKCKGGGEITTPPVETCRNCNGTGYAIYECL